MGHTDNMSRYLSLIFLVVTKMRPRTPFAMKFALLACTIVVAQSALAFYNPSTGRWLSRDPVGERGGLNLHGFAANTPVSGFDGLGLAYTITDLTPSGLWMLLVSRPTASAAGQ